MFDSEYEETEQGTRDAIDFISRDFAIQKKRTIYLAGSFITSCAVSYPFMAGHALNRYWSAFGKFLPLVAIALFIGLILQLLRLQLAWHERRKAVRDLN